MKQNSFWKNWTTKLAWLAFFVITGGGSAYYVLHCVRPPKDETPGEIIGNSGKPIVVPTEKDNMPVALLKHFQTSADSAEDSIDSRTTGFRVGIV